MEIKDITDVLFKCKRLFSTRTLEGGVCDGYATPRRKTRERWIEEESDKVGEEQEDGWRNVCVEGDSRKKP